MQNKFINALADVLGIDLRDLRGLSDDDKLAMLEAKQAEAINSLTVNI